MRFWLWIRWSWTPPSNNCNPSKCPIEWNREREKEKILAWMDTSNLVEWLMTGMRKLKKIFSTQTKRARERGYKMNLPCLLSLCCSCCYCYFCYWSCCCCCLMGVNLFASIVSKFTPVICHTLVSWLMDRTVSDIDYCILYSRGMCDSMFR